MALRVFSALLFGAAIGSFLNVVIHRVPRGESVVAPASRCPSCGHAIAPRDNIPLLSWVLLRGRCRYCGASIGARYAIVELTNVGLWIAAAVRFANLEEAIFVALFCSVLLALAVIDLEHRRLPNSIVLPVTGTAAVWIFVVALVTGRLNVAETALVCSVAAFALLFVIALVSGGMGFGDVKMAAFIGLATGRFGWQVTVAAIFGAFFAGGIVGVVLLATRRAGRKQAIPFGPALAFGAVLAMFLGPAPVRAWLGL